MAMDSRPICFIKARRRRPNSSRAIVGIVAAPAADLRRVLMDGRGAGRRLLATRRRELHEQQLRAYAYEFHHFGEGNFTLFIAVAGLDTDLRDFGEVAD